MKIRGKRLYPSDSIEKIDRFLHCHDQVNSTVVQLNRANALLKLEIM